MTRKLYDENAYETSFEAKVVSCEKTDKGFMITLDQTLFFPEEGGQSSDKGTINGKEVLHVKIKGDEIFHLMDEPLPEGAKVNGIIDFSHRFSNMQMHSGEHIFTGLVYSRFGYNNVGFHLSENSATIDVGGKLNDEELSAIEKKVNQIIVENREIKAWYPAKEELDALSYRSKKEIEGDVRIVEVDGVDICACCAPHVKRTGEVGLFKIIKAENYKGGIRVHYLCGFRALADYSSRLNSLSKISVELNCKEGTEAEAVSYMHEQYKNAEFENNGLKLKLIEQKIEADFTGDENGIYVGSLTESQYMKGTVNILKRKYNGICAVFCGDEENGYRYLIESESIDLTDLSLKLKENLDAKGGGKRNSIQGSVNSSIDEIKKYV